MIKKVNVIPHTPVYGIEKAIIDPAVGVELWCGDIQHCILCGAEVYEILENSELLRLNLQNFNIDNNKKEEVLPEQPPVVEPEQPQPPTEEGNGEVQPPTEEGNGEVPPVIEGEVPEPTPEEEVIEQPTEELSRSEKKKNRR